MIDRPASTEPTTASGVPLALPSGGGGARGSVGVLRRLANGQSLVVPDISNPDDPVASRAELEAALGRPLKPTFGVIPIASASRLESAQRVVTLFDALVLVLFAVTALLAIAAVALARQRLRMVALLGIAGLASLLAVRLLVSSAADGISSALAGSGAGAIIGVEAIAKVAESYRDIARLRLLIALVAAAAATAIAWLLERDLRTAGGGSTLQQAARADASFLAFAGLSIALAALLMVGLTAVTLVVAVGGYVVWLAVVLLSRRRAGAAATA